MGTVTYHEHHGFETERVKNILLWCLQIIGGFIFVMAGLNKLTGSELMVQTFQMIGFGIWFMYFIGIVELCAGVLLFTPRHSIIGAYLLIVTMLGAILTHLFFIGGSVAPAAFYLVIGLIISYGRRDQLAVRDA
jgi:uncharacterized membrane protein YphA (DoxX/SURF4 family)